MLKFGKKKKKIRRQNVKVLNLALAPCSCCNFYDMCAGHVVLPHDSRRLELLTLPQTQIIAFMMVMIIDGGKGGWGWWQRPTSTSVEKITEISSHVRLVISTGWSQIWVPKVVSVVVGEIRCYLLHVFHRECRIKAQSGNDCFFSLSAQLVIHYVLLFEAIWSNIATASLNRTQINT